MDDDKSVLKKISDTVKAAVDSIAHPTGGTPMEMPLNESGFAITHLKSAPKSKTRKKAAKKTARWSSKKSGQTGGRAAKKSVKKAVKKKKAK